MAMASTPTVFHFLTKQTTPPKPQFLSPNFLLRRHIRSPPPQSNRPKRTESICPVPEDQLPVNEYQSLSTSFPFSWAAGSLVEYCSRLFATGLSFAVVVGLPVAFADPDLSRRFLSVVSSGVIVVAIAVVRMYLGWAYVGNRLLSATVEYEETGWYDGQMWVKTAEVLTRDRLLGSFSVKPVLSRLKNTLVTLGLSLLVCVALLVNIEESHKKSNAEISEERTRVIPGVYSDEAARSFEPDAFCGEPAIP